MNKIILIDDKEYNAVYKGITARIYREYFQSDLFVDLNKIADGFQDNLKQIVKTSQVDTNDVDLSMMVIEQGGSHFMEKIVWCAIYSGYALEKKQFMGFNDFVDNIDDYATLMSAGIDVYTMMIYGNTTIETPEKQEGEEPSKKKEE